jgi:hypothetical protein
MKPVSALPGPTKIPVTRPAADFFVYRVSNEGYDSLKEKTDEANEFFAAARAFCKTINQKKPSLKCFAATFRPENSDFPSRARIYRKLPVTDFGWMYFCCDDVAITAPEDWEDNGIEEGDYVTINKRDNGVPPFDEVMLVADIMGYSINQLGENARQKAGELFVRPLKYEDDGVQDEYFSILEFNTRNVIKKKGLWG